MELISFPMAGSRVDLAERVGTHYFKFGVLLLQDNNGDVVSAFEKELGRNASEINQAILRRWLQGKGRQPVTWDTLLAVLQDIGLNSLAKQVKETLHC